MADKATEGTGGNSASQLKALVERIETQNSRVADEREDLKQIYSEAKTYGYQTKVLRKLIARRAMAKAKRDEEDALLETYEGAVGL